MYYLKYLWLGNCDGSDPPGYIAFTYITISVIEFFILAIIAKFIYNYFMIIFCNIKLKVICKFKYPTDLEVVEKIKGNKIYMSCLKNPNKS